MCRPIPGRLPSPQGSLKPVHEDIPVPGGIYAMGDAFGEGYPGDGESPAHQVRVDSFTIDATAVTNRMFAAFTASTGYRTEAEVYGSSAVFHLLSTAKTDDILGVAAGAPWWLNIRGADWAHPTGPDSHWEDFPDHPVVHISHNDAALTALGRTSACPPRRNGSTPPAADWKASATPGEMNSHPTANTAATSGKAHSPKTNTTDDGYLGTAPVKAFPPNGYGLYEVAGNVWEWCSDWFLPKYYRNSPVDNPQGPIDRVRARHARRLLPLPRLILQPVPCRGTHCEHPRILQRQLRIPHCSLLGRHERNGETHDVPDWPRRYCPTPPPR